MTRSAEAGRVMKVQPVYARLEQEQYEWLRRYSFENRVAQAAVLRQALEMFREAKEGTTMRKIEVVVIENVRSAPALSPLQKSCTAQPIKTTVFL